MPSICHFDGKNHHMHITDIRELHEKNVLTFFTHNNIGLIVSIFNLYKKICEKMCSDWITDVSDWGEDGEILGKTYLWELQFLY